MAKGKQKKLLKVDVSNWRSSSGKSVKDLAQEMTDCSYNENDPSFKEAKLAGLLPSISSNFIFGVNKDKEFGILVNICPAEYWKENKCVFCEEIDVDLIGLPLYSFAKNTFDFGFGDAPRTVKEAKDYLSGFGLIKNKEFSKFVKKNMVRN